MAELELEVEGPKGDDPYKVEPAKSNRSACKACKEKIEKDEVRFGSFIDMGGHGSYHWRHVTCITAKQAENVELKIGKIESIAGYETLTPGQQTKLCKAFAAARKAGDAKDKAKAKAKAKAEAAATAKATKKEKAKAKKEALAKKKAEAKAKKAAAKAKLKAKPAAKIGKAEVDAGDEAEAEGEGDLKARAVAADADMPSVQEQHSFLDAAKRFDFDRVRDLVEENPAYVNVQPGGRWSALHQAAEQGDIEMVSYLIEKGASVSAKTKDGKKPHDVAKDNCKALLASAGKRTGDESGPPAKRRAT